MEETGRSRLSRQRAATAALELIDRDGFEAFSMRALGRELGVDPMAVYHYVPSRQSLFDAIVEVAWSEVALPAPAPRWQEQLWALAREVRAMLRRHANALPILATRSSGVEGLRVLDHGIATLRRAGLPGREAFAVVNAASSLLIGHALAEVGAPPGGVASATDEEVAAMVGSAAVRGALGDLAAAIADGGPPGWDEMFEAGLGTLIRGVEARLIRCRGSC